MARRPPRIADDRALVIAHMSRTYRRIFDVVVKIPRGRVMTYGQVAEAAGLPRAARVVGYAMHALGEHLPWQRVVGKKGPGRGGVSIKDPLGGAVQRQLLQKEGVRFSKTGAIELAKYGWGPPARRARKRRSRPA